MPSVAPDLGLPRFPPSPPNQHSKQASGCGNDPYTAPCGGECGSGAAELQPRPATWNLSDSPSHSAIILFHIRRPYCSLALNAVPYPKKMPVTISSVVLKGLHHGSKPSSFSEASSRTQEGFGPVGFLDSLCSYLSVTSDFVYLMSPFMPQF